MLKKQLFILVVAATALFGLAKGYASDASVLRCRATEESRIAAGQCGAHGCDCGILKSECAAEIEFMKTVSPGAAAWMRSKYAIDHACKRKDH
jgi:hypothetical protein